MLIEIGGFLCEYEYLDDYDGEMDEVDIAHVAALLDGGFIGGELSTFDGVTDDVHRGYWRLSRQPAL